MLFRCFTPIPPLFREPLGWQNIKVQLGWSRAGCPQALWGSLGLQPALETFLYFSLMEGWRGSEVSLSLPFLSPCPRPPCFAVSKLGREQVPVRDSQSFPLSILQRQARCWSRCAFCRVSWAALGSSPWDQVWDWSTAIPQGILHTHKQPCFCTTASHQGVPAHGKGLQWDEL